MSEFFAMGGHGIYIWLSYAVFVLVLLWDGLSPWWRIRRLQRALQLRRRREAARASARSEDNTMKGNA